MELKPKIKSLFLMLLLNIIVQLVIAQSERFNSPVEQLYLITDRNFYIVEEKIHIKIIDIKNDISDSVIWSTIVYVDLISPNGRELVLKKINLNERTANGELIIPRNVLSGNYYIRAYTKWMRNDSPYSYFYKQIKIINPFQTELLSGSSAAYEPVRFHQPLKSMVNFVQVETDSDSVSTNNQLNFKIYSNQPDNIYCDLSVSLVRKGSNRPNDLIQFEPEKNDNEIKYIPETRGVSLSGKVINKTDSLPVAYAKVWITLIDSQTVSREMMTDAYGTFNFNLGNGFGQHELFIQASSPNKSVVPIVLIDKDYASTLINLPFVPFQINEDEKEMSQSLMMNGQLQNLFRETPKIDTSAFISNRFFYGQPDQILEFKDYIEMPTVGDYVYELLMNVILKKKAGFQYFKIIGNYPELAIYDPLVMVDLKKIEDVTNVLNLSPKEIDRVELIYKPFVRGEIIYGGIVHFISKNPEQSTLKFPEESMILGYNLLGKLADIENSKVEDVMPNVGNCLYWNPSVRLENNSQYSVSIPAGAEPGLFEIVIEGLDHQSQPFQVRKSIVVY